MVAIVYSVWHVTLIMISATGFPRLPAAVGTESDIAGCRFQVLESIPGFQVVPSTEFGMYQLPGGSESEILESMCT